VPVTVDALFSLLGPLVADLHQVAWPLPPEVRAVVVRYLREVSEVLLRYADDV
jgi:hypothetical protein